MNRNPQLGSLADSTATSAVPRLFLIGMKALFRRGMLTRSDAIDAALASIFVSFVYPALLRFYERRKSVLVHKSLPLP